MKQALILLERARDIVSDVEDDESDALDNMPENLQDSERCEKMQNAIDMLSCAIEHIDDACECIDRLVC